jgi:hypothetical protein
MDSCPCSCLPDQLVMGASKKWSLDWLARLKFDKSLARLSCPLIDHLVFEEVAKIKRFVGHCVVSTAFCV